MMVGMDPTADVGHPDLARIEATTSPRCPNGHEPEHAYVEHVEIGYESYPVQIDHCRACDRERTQP